MVKKRRKIKVGMTEALVLGGGAAGLAATAATGQPIYAVVVPAAGGLAAAYEIKLQEWLRKHKMKSKGKLKKVA